MKIVGAILGRMDSSRMWGKSMAPICGYPSAWHCAERIKAVCDIGEIWLISTDAPEDKEMIAFAESQGWKYVVRPNGGIDVAAGYGLLHKAARADIYLEVGCDMPLSYIEAGIRMLDLYLAGASYVHAQEYPEWMRMVSLVQPIPAWLMELRARYCDTDFLRNHPGDLVVQKPELLPSRGARIFECTPDEWGHKTHRLTLDWPQDAYVITSVYHALWDGKHVFDTPVALDYMDAHPELSRYNRYCPESQANTDGLLIAKTNPALPRFIHRVNAEHDPQNRIQLCERCEAYLGYVREDSGHHWFYLPDGTAIKGRGKVICWKCKHTRDWYEDR
jgi:spore coat polysaccharide biosynthesis protein SpsF (cytidylyltransferase family)